MEAGRPDLSLFDNLPVPIAAVSKSLAVDDVFPTAIPALCRDGARSGGRNPTVREIEQNQR